MTVFSKQSSSSPTAEQLPSWTFDPRRSKASFHGRRMGTVWVDGQFKDVQGKFLWDVENPLNSSCVGEIDVANLYAGEPYLNTELRAADFLDGTHHRTISFAARLVDRAGEKDFKADVLLTLRGASRHVVMDLVYLGEWDAPLCVDGQTIGTATRMGLRAEGVITRQDFESVDAAGRSNGNHRAANAIEITLDVEAIRDADLRDVAAIGPPAHRPRS
jgi:polyisoprenoid-binding protein YceI